MIQIVDKYLVTEPRIDLQEQVNEFVINLEGSNSDSSIDTDQYSEGSDKYNNISFMGVCF